MGPNNTTEIAFILDTRGRISEHQTILCLLVHALVPRRPIWKQQQARAQQKGPSKRKIHFPLRTARASPVLTLIHFVRPLLSLIVGARSVHTQTISPAESIDLMTTSSGCDRWGKREKRERYIMGKARLIMGDHRAALITLTSALKHACAPSSQHSHSKGPMSELVSFVFTAKFPYS